MKRLSLFFFAAVLLPFSTHAQPVWDAGPTLRKGFQLELTRGVWKDSEDVIGPASAHGFVSGSLPLDPDTYLHLEVPFSNGHSDAEFLDSKFVIGNPRISLHRTVQAFDLQLGVRLPMTGDDGGLATQLPIFAENDRIWSFFPDLASIEIGSTAETALSDRISLRAQLLPQVIIPTDCDGCDPELFLVHGIGVSSKFEQVEAGLGVTGIAWRSEESTGNSLLDDNYMLGGSLALKANKVIPEILIRLPMNDEVRDMASALVTLSVKVLVD